MFVLSVSLVISESVSFPKHNFLHVKLSLGGPHETASKLAAHFLPMSINAPVAQARHQHQLRTEFKFTNYYLHVTKTFFGNGRVKKKKTTTFSLIVIWWWVDETQVFMLEIVNNSDHKFSSSGGALAAAEK